MHHKICRSKIELYTLRLGEGLYFKRGRYFVFGEFQGFRFLCHGVSGSQSLWLPLKSKTGLKIFHPKGFSGTLRKAWTHFKVQRMMADVGLAPSPLSLFKLTVHFVNSKVAVASNPLDVKFVKPVNAFNSPWQCYAIMMERVLRGTLNQVLLNLGRFGVEITDSVCQTVIHYLSKRSDDALNLFEYQQLCSFLGGHEESHIQEIMKNIKEQLPQSIDEGIDLFSLQNIVLDIDGKPKVIDADLARIKIC